MGWKDMILRTLAAMLALIALAAAPAAAGDEKLRIIGENKAFVVETDVHHPTDINLLLDAVRKAIETVASTYEQSREVVQMYYNNPDLLQAIEGSVLEEQVVDWVLDNAKVSAEPMAFNELIGAAASSRQGL